MFLGRGGETPYHSHNAFKLVISLEDRPIKVDGPAGDQQGPVVMVRANQNHRVRTFGATVAVLFVEPEGPAGRRLSAIERLGGHWPAVNDDHREALRRLANGAQPAPAFEVAYQALLDTLRPPGRSADAPLDRRVRTTLRLLRGAGSERARTADLASRVELSASRLAHLIQAELGLSVARYRRWHRLRRAAERIALGATITDTAHECGFADSAHLSRTFVAMLGITPSIFRASHIVVPAEARLIVDALGPEFEVPIGVQSGGREGSEATPGYRAAR
jgi:AraC-like DNA-binding protein